MLAQEAPTIINQGTRQNHEGRFRPERGASQTLGRDHCMAQALTLARYHVELGFVLQFVRDLGGICLLFLGRRRYEHYRYLERTMVSRRVGQGSASSPPSKDESRGRRLDKIWGEAWPAIGGDAPPQTLATSRASAQLFSSLTANIGGMYRDEPAGWHVEQFQPIESTLTALSTSRGPEPVRFLSVPTGQLFPLACLPRLRPAMLSRLCVASQR